MNRRIAFLIGVCLVAALVTGNILPSQAEDYGVGDQPYGVAIGDLNEDGKPDLAIAVTGSNYVSVFLGKGDGTFQAPVNYGAGDAPSCLSISDLDGDNHLDLAVSNWESYNVSVLLGNGDGTFQDAVNYGVGDTPYTVAIGELNGDGHVDLAVANAMNDNVSVLLGNGDGTFQAAVNYGVGAYPQDVAMGHLDGDNDLDLAVSNRYSDNISVLLGNGDGTFQAAVNYDAGSMPVSVPMVDLDGDGNLDLAVANAGSDNVSVFLGKGDGSFQAPVNYSVGDEPSYPAIGDLDGDGNLDLAVSNRYSYDVSVLLGNGDGTFQAAVTYGVGHEPLHLAMGDLDGDNDLDLAVSNWGSDTVSVLLNNGDGTFPCSLPGIPSLSTPSDGATDVSTTPVLSWGAGPGANSYDVQVCSDSGCSTVVTSASGLTATEWKVSPALDKSTTYFWCARANNDCGPGSWTGTWSFTPSRSDFVLMNPTDASEISSPPTFQWAAGPYDVFAFFSYFYYSGHGYYLYPPKGKSFLWLNDTSLAMPVAWWNKLAIGQPQYWTVLGVNTATKNWEVAGTWSFKKVRFPGGTFDFHITAMDQQPADCLMPQYLLNYLVSMLQPAVVPVVLPPEDKYPTLVSLPLPPPIGTISFRARFVGGQIVCDPNNITGIDLGSLGIPIYGLNCLLEATGSGGTTVLTQSNAEAVINLTNMSATTGSGTGPCYLNPQGCTVSVTLKGAVE